MPKFNLLSAVWPWSSYSASLNFSFPEMIRVYFPHVYFANKIGAKWQAMPGTQWFLWKHHLLLTLWLFQGLLKESDGLVVQSWSNVQLFVTSWTAACQGFLSFTISQSLLKLMSIELMMPSNHLILCCPLFPPAFNLSQHQGLSNESALHIRWPKYWSFSFSICPSNEYWGLISYTWLYTCNVYVVIHICNNMCADWILVELVFCVPAVKCCFLSRICFI